MNDTPIPNCKLCGKPPDRVRAVSDGSGEWLLSCETANCAMTGHYYERDWRAMHTPIPTWAFIRSDIAGGRLLGEDRTVLAFNVSHGLWLSTAFSSIISNPKNWPRWIELPPKPELPVDPFLEWWDKLAGQEAMTPQNLARAAWEASLGQRRVFFGA